MPPTPTAPSPLPSPTTPMAETPLPTTPAPDTFTPTPSSHNTNIQTENETLKKKIAELELKIGNILNHSIESDNRLQQYTSEIRLLESENKTLKQEIEELRASPQPIQLKSPSLPRGYKIPTQNRFEALTLEEENNFDEEHNTFKTVKRKEKKRKTPTSKNKTKLRRNSGKHITKQTKLNFNKITIIGDSHTRHLAAKIQKIVNPGTSITGMCKPGAGLIQIAPAISPPPPPGHCFVVFAGTNDLASGREDIILSEMEKLIVDCSKCSKVLLSPLPYRHDLPPADQIHQTTQLINEYMSELCIRHPGVEFLDLSGVGRQHFTQHGMHLTDSGKSLLAEEIVRTLSRMKPLPRHRMLSINTPQPPETPPRPGPSSLPHETYAQAVTPRTSSPPRPAADLGPLASVQPTTNTLNTPKRQTDALQTKYQFVFLEGPLKAQN